MFQSRYPNRYPTTQIGNKESNHLSDRINLDKMLVPNEDCMSQNLFRVNSIRIVLVKITNYLTYLTSEIWSAEIGLVEISISSTYIDCNHSDLINLLSRASFRLPA